MTRRMKFDQDANNVTPDNVKIYRNWETKEIAPNSLVEALKSLESFDKSFLSYLAGYTEADGCIHIGASYQMPVDKSSGRMIKYRIHVVVTQKDPRSLFMFQKAFGGRLKPVIRNHKSGKKKYFQWVLTANRAYACLYLLSPYLKFKHEQAMVAMSLQEDINNWKYNFSSRYKLPPEVRAYRRSLYLRCKYLNSTRYVESICATLGEIGEPLPETTPSQAMADTGAMEGVTARLVSSNNNPAQERPTCPSSQKEIA